VSTLSSDLASIIFRILPWLLCHCGDLLFWEGGYGKVKS